MTDTISILYKPSIKCFAANYVKQGGFIDRSY